MQLKVFNDGIPLTSALINLYVSSDVFEMLRNGSLLYLPTNCHQIVPQRADIVAIRSTKEAEPSATPQYFLIQMVMIGPLYNQEPGKCILHLLPIVEAELTEVREPNPVPPPPADVMPARVVPIPPTAAAPTPVVETTAAEPGA